MKSDKKLYLKHRWGSFGVVGKETVMTDCYNNPLFVGDIVAVYDPLNELLAKSFVATDEVLKFSFISGYVREYNEFSKIKGRLKVFKLKSYNELKVGNEFSSPITDVIVSEE